MSAAPRLGEQLLGEARLAHSWLPPEHDQAAVPAGSLVQAVDQLGAFFFPAYKWSPLGQLMGNGLLLGWCRPGHFEKLPAVIKPLEPKPASVDEVTFGNLARELFDDAGDQDLVALGLGRHPRRSVDRGAEEVAILLTDLAAVQPDADVDLAPGVLVVVLVDRLLDGDRAGDRLPGRGEGNHEAVAKRLDLAPGMSLDLVTHQVALGAQDRACGFVPTLVAHLGGALDIGEEDGDRPFEHFLSRCCRQILTSAR